MVDKFCCRPLTVLAGGMLIRLGDRDERPAKDLTLRNLATARRLSPRSHHRGAAGADLRHHQLPVPEHRPRRPAVRPAGVRQHLHPDHESDHRRAGKADRGAGRRGSGTGDQFRSRRAIPDLHHLGRGRRQHRFHPQSVRRQHQPVESHPAAPGHSNPLYGPRRTPGGIPGAERPPHPRLVHRIHRQSGAEHPRLRGDFRCRATSRDRGRRGQHLRPGRLSVPAD